MARSRNQVDIKKVSTSRTSETVDSTPRLQEELEGRQVLLNESTTIGAACAADRQRVENASPKPSTGTAENYLVAGATTQMLHDQIAVLNSVKEAYLKNVELFSSLKAAIHSYVTDTLIAIEFGDVAESIFDALRHDVDTFIRSHSPKSAEKLVAIAERMAEEA